MRSEVEEQEGPSRVEELLARLDGTAEPTSRAGILIEVAATLRDGLGDHAQALDASSRRGARTR